MNFVDEIKKETIIITNKYAKEKIIRSNILKPIKFMNINELKEKYYFSYDENTILYIMHKLNIKYEIAKEYLEAIYYIKEEEYKNNKLSFLKELKKDLIDNNLITINDMYKEYIKRTPIIIYNEDINKLPPDIFNELDIKVIDRKPGKYNHDIYEFDTISDEIRYIASDIADKINNGIYINKIKLTNIDKSYYNTIERIFSLYGLKVNIPYRRSLASYPQIKEFLKSYNLDNISLELDKIPDNNDIYDKLVSTINKYLKYNNKDLITYKIENTYLNSPNYNNDIEIVDYLDYEANDDEYIYMPGFNEELIPRTNYDTEYLDDNAKKCLGMKSTKELNSIIINNTLNSIKNIKNLIITYKLKDEHKKYYPSSLTSNFNVIKKEIDYQKSYSETYDKIMLASEYDNYIKYGAISNIFDILNNNYLIPYNTYSNKYHKINRTMTKLNLSYSKMQIYNKCAFKYYLSDILKLDIYEENFSTIIGSMVHSVMENVLRNNDYDIDKYMNKFLENKVFTNKEKFFLIKYKQSIKELLDQVLLEKKYCSLDNAMYEKKIDIDCSNNIHFTGIIDKILYKEINNKTYISLIDYKTGQDDISLKYLKYGINIQLPIYLYLSTKLAFNNPKYCGLYLQKLNITDKDYRLIGYSNSNKDILEKMDNNYDNSSIIKGLKTIKDGSFSKNSKILSDDELESIKEEVGNVINNTINNIKDNNFDINPKIDIDSGKNLSCEYCRFNDICFKRKTDEVLITPPLGDDDNGLH